MHEHETSEPKNSMLKDSLEKFREKLLETGTRNHLIHINLASRSLKGLNIKDQNSNEIFTLIRDRKVDGEFRSQRLVEKPDEEDEIPLDCNAMLQTELEKEKLFRKLTRMHKDAKIAESEQGINILYLALGFLHWTDDTKTERCAPLILLPVELVRRKGRNAFELRCRDDDVITNLSLQKRIREYGIELPKIGDINTEGWSPDIYFAEIREVLAEKPDWHVEPDLVYLGFFSFAKISMLEDLKPENWDIPLENHEIIGSILSADGFEPPEPTEFDDENANIDDILPDPASIIQVVDADASQTKVIEETRKRRNLVVQGPPGTGKSQTIVNIIAAAVKDGKTVLFVAEKMAALEVVYKRLKDVGMAPLCLELHSRKTSKKAFMDEMLKTTETRHKSRQEAISGDLKSVRERLNDINRKLNAELPGCEYSTNEVLAEMGDYLQKHEPAELQCPDLKTLTNQERIAITEAIEKLIAEVNRVGARDQHPYHKTTRNDLSPPDQDRLRNEIEDCENELNNFIQFFNQFTAETALQFPETFTDVEKLTELLTNIESKPDLDLELLQILYANKINQDVGNALNAGLKLAENGNIFKPAAYATDIAGMRSAIAKGTVSFWQRMFGKYRGASSEFATLLNHEMPKSPEQRLELADLLLDLAEKKHYLQTREAFMADIFGTVWRGLDTDFKMLCSLKGWMDENAEAISKFSMHSVSTLISAPNLSGRNAAIARFLNDIRSKTKRIETRLGAGGKFDIRNINNLLGAVQDLLPLEKYEDWCKLNKAAEDLDKQLIDFDLVWWREKLEAGVQMPNPPVHEFNYAVAEARYENAKTANPWLEQDMDCLKSFDRHKLVGEFQQLEHDHFKAVANDILYEWHAKCPKNGSVGDVRKLTNYKRTSPPIRALIKKTAATIQRIKPVFLMSPVSVAQFLKPGALEFDMLVIDEASQVRPEDALGAMARCRQIIVVGDKKQLPPTSFFSRMGAVDDEYDENENEDEAAIKEDINHESILTLCEDKSLRSRMLEWHYRSKTPSLIRVSNKEFYRNLLKLAPSKYQDSEDYGLKFNYVPGIYASGNSGERKGTNRVEARHVVRRMVEHWQKTPRKSLGVVAFSKAQSDMITEEIENERRINSGFDEYLIERPGLDNVFVKNIENVQGDERDVILISVGYGPREAGGRLASMNFGPVSKEGGERRLNVLFTRAKELCEVYASFEPENINADGKSEGAKILKEFLVFAKTGIMPDIKDDGGEADSFFEIDVADEIKRMGLGVDVVHQVGSDGFFIDIGVKYESNFILAVECDGATYHSSMSARERDRQRQEILERGGWTFHRIWSTDWFYNRRVELEKLRTAIVQAKDGKSVNAVVKDRIGTEKNIIEELEETDGNNSFDVPKYKKCFLAAESGDMFNAPSARIASMIDTVVETEGPVHFDIIVSRIRKAFGKGSAGEKTRQFVKSRFGVDFKNDESFWYKNDQMEKVGVRDRTDMDEERDIKYVPDTEIRNAFRMIESECGKVGDDEKEDTAKIISQMLGFQNMSAKTKDAIMRVIGNM